MSNMEKSGGRRARRIFSDEFRAGAVRLVLDEGKTVGGVARDLDLTPSALQGWVVWAPRIGPRASRVGSPPSSARNWPGCAKRTGSCDWSEMC